MILQALVDAELEDSTFIWHPEINFVHVTLDIFRKEKKSGEKDAEEENLKEEHDHSVVFKVEGSQCPPSFVPGSQIDPEVQGSQMFHIYLLCKYVYISKVLIIT
jgi:hypothetical protein